MYLFWKVLYCVIVTTAKNIVISPIFLVWKFCGKEQFPHSGEITVFFRTELLPKSSSTIDTFILNNPIPKLRTGFSQKVAAR